MNAITYLTRNTEHGTQSAHMNNGRRIGLTAVQYNTLVTAGKKEVMLSTPRDKDGNEIKNDRGEMWVVCGGDGSIYLAKLLDKLMQLPAQSKGVEVPEIEAPKVERSETAVSIIHNITIERDYKNPKWKSKAIMRSGRKRR